MYDLTVAVPECPTPTCTSPSQTKSQNGEIKNGHRSLPPALELLLAAEKGRKSQRVAPGKINHSPVGVHTFKGMWATRIALGGFCGGGVLFCFVFKDTTLQE